MIDSNNLKNMPPIIEFFTKMASAIFTLLLGKLLYDQTNSLWAFATAYGGEFVIVSIIQLYAGTFADRYSPTKILIAINALNVIVFGTLSIGYDDPSTLGLLFAAAMVYVSRPFYRTSLFVLVREITNKQHLKVVNGRITSCSQLGQIVGLSLTGLLLSSYTSIKVLYLMTFIYCFCFAVSIFIYLKHIEKYSGQKSNMKKLNWSDFAFVINNNRSFLVRLLSSFSIAVSLSGFYVLLAPLVSEKFSNNTEWLSWLSVSYALGAILSGIFVKQSEVLVTTRSSDNFLLLNQVVSSFSFLSYGLCDELFWLPVLLFCLGTTTTLAAVSLASYLQTITLDGIAGRTSAVQNIIIAFGNAFAAFFCSFLFEWSFDVAAIGLALLILTLMCLSITCFKLFPEAECGHSMSMIRRTD